MDSPSLEQRLLIMDVETISELLQRSSEIESSISKYNQKGLIVVIHTYTKNDLLDYHERKQLYKWLRSLPVVTSCINLKNQDDITLELMMMFDLQFAKEDWQIDKSIIDKKMVFDFYERYEELVGRRKLTRLRMKFASNTEKIKSSLIKEVSSIQENYKEEIISYYNKLIGEKTDEEIDAFFKCIITRRQQEEKNDKLLLTIESEQFCKLIIRK